MKKILVLWNKFIEISLYFLWEIINGSVPAVWQKMNHDDGIQWRHRVSRDEILGAN